MQQNRKQKEVQDREILWMLEIRLCFQVFKVDLMLPFWGCEVFIE